MQNNMILRTSFLWVQRAWQQRDWPCMRQPQQLSRMRRQPLLQILLLCPSCKKSATPRTRMSSLIFRPGCRCWSRYAICLLTPLYTLFPALLQSALCQLSLHMRRFPHALLAKGNGATDKLRQAPSGPFAQVKLEGRADQAQREALKRRLLELRTRLTVLQPRVEALVASSQVAPEADPAGPPAHRTAAEPEAQRQPSEQPAQQPAEQEMSPAVRRVEAGQIVDDGPGPLPDRPGSASHPPEVKQEPQPTLGDVFGSSDDEDALAGQPSAAIQVQAVPSGLKQKLLAEVSTI